MLAMPCQALPCLANGMARHDMARHDMAWQSVALAGRSCRGGSLAPPKPSEQSEAFGFAEAKGFALLGKPPALPTGEALSRKASKTKPRWRQG